jgi:hypothetical protein
MTTVARLFPRSCLCRFGGKWIGGTTYGLSDQMPPVLSDHGFAGFKNEGQRKAYWPPNTIYEWLSNHEKGSLER